MKKFYILIFTLLCLNGTFAQTTYTSVASGNWNNSATWSPSGVPTATSPIVILGHTITVTTNAMCASVTAKGSASGTSILTINSGSKLTLTGNFVVEPTNSYNNDTYINGDGMLDVSNLQVGFATVNNIFPTTTRLTTLYVDDLAELKINQNLISTTAVNGSTYNESRLRHRSGLIDLAGLLSIPTVGSGPSALGYRTDNDNQGNSTIIFRNTNPGIPTDVQKAPSFTGGTVEFRSTATTDYTFPSLAYKNLVLNSNRTFISGGSSTSIISGGKFNLKLGIFSSSAANQLRINDGITVIRSGGSFAIGSNSRMRLTNASIRYNVLYEQHTSPIVINDLPAYYPGNTLINSIKTVEVNSANGVTLNTNTIQIENLIVNKSCTINGTGKVFVTNLFDVPNAITVSFPDNLLKLLSNTDGTARVSQLNPGTVVNGKVVVERFLPNSRRSWRLLTAPVRGATGNSVWENWQNNGLYSGADIGVDIWGPDGTLQAEDTGSTIQIKANGNGLTLINNSSYNMRKFDNLAGMWSNVSNTLNQPLFTSGINQGFLIFATNPFLGASDLFGVGSTGSSQTVLSASGQLITGDVTYSDIASNRFYLIGNPYASPIDFEQIMADPVNSGIDKIWFIDPTVGGLGGYVTWQEGFGYSNGATSFKESTLLQSGQAFFVRATANSSSLTIKESHKSTLSSNTTINRTSSNNTKSTLELFRILLERGNDAIYTNMDGVVAAFYAGASNNVDTNDAGKLSNPSETLALFNSNSSLSIEHREPIQDNDILTLRISQMAVGANYKLKLHTENFTYKGNAFLKDVFLGTTTQIALNGSVFEYPFKVTSDALSTGNRFTITFKTDLSLSLTDAATMIFNISPNPAASQDSINVLFNSGTDSDGYTYKIFNIHGQLVGEGRLSVKNLYGAIDLHGSLSSGLYFIQLQRDDSNDRFTTKLIIK
ncbi:MAG: T9SS type A sorting domain-containing protein [Flavobacterium sp.]|nr:T9SS type A sorting domain-containing protein [Flavobacterium sp.]